MHGGPRERHTGPRGRSKLGRSEAAMLGAGQAKLTLIKTDGLVHNGFESNHRHG